MTAPHALSWSERLDRCQTPAQVVEIARDYLAAVDQAVLVALPPDCRPSRMVEPHDVLEYAYFLVRTHCVTRNPALEERLDRLARFFAQAALRVSEVTVFGAPLLSETTESEENDARATHGR